MIVSDSARIFNCWLSGLFFQPGLKSSTPTGKPSGGNCIMLHSTISTI